MKNTAVSLPTPAGSPTRRMNRAETKSTCSPSRSRARSSKSRQMAAENLSGGRSGTELFYIAEDRTLMAVPVKVAESAAEPFQVGSPKRLFPMPFVDTFIIGLSYEVSRDGERFLMPASLGGAAAPPLTVVLNWQTQLKN